MKLVDVLDSKSSGPCVRVGSSPTSGTRLNRGLGGHAESLFSSEIR